MQKKHSGQYDNNEDGQQRHTTPSETVLKNLRELTDKFHQELRENRLATEKLVIELKQDLEFTWGGTAFK
jgi:hypothetical protein